MVGEQEAGERKALWLVRAFAALFAASGLILIALASLAAGPATLKAPDLAAAALLILLGAGLWFRSRIAYYAGFVAGAFMFLSSLFAMGAMLLILLAFSDSSTSAATPMLLTLLVFLPGLALPIAYFVVFLRKEVKALFAKKDAKTAGVKA